MRYASFWEGGSLSFEQIPTLQELFSLCDRALLARVAEEGEDAMEGVSLRAEARQRGCGEIGEALEAVCAVELEEACGDDGPMAVLMPEEEFSVREQPEALARRVGLSLMCLDDVDAMRPYVRFDAARVEPRGYAGAPWEEVLAYRVWLGGLRSRKERYMALASALCTLMRAKEVRTGAAHASFAPAAETGRAELRRKLRGTTVTEAQQLLAQAYGLAEDDRFEEEHRLRLSRRAEELNLAARAELRTRFVDLARRLAASRTPREG